jgi:hypothetical protein
MGELWLPFPRAQLIGMKRCAECGCHPEKQGHKDECPHREET